MMISQLLKENEYDYVTPMESVCLTSKEKLVNRNWNYFWIIVKNSGRCAFYQINIGIG